MAEPPDREETPDGVDPAADPGPPPPAVPPHAYPPPGAYPYPPYGYDPYGYYAQPPYAPGPGQPDQQAPPPPASPPPDQQASTYAYPGYPPHGYYAYYPQPGYPPQGYAPAPYPPPGYPPAYGYGYPGYPSYPPPPPAKPVYEPPPGEYEFTRLARAKRRFAHWRLPVVGVIFVGLVFASMIVMVIGLFAVFVGDPVGLDAFLRSLEDLDVTDPAVFVFAMLSIIVWLPLLWAAAAMVGYRPFGWFSSVQGRLRWAWLGRCLVAAIVIYVVGFAALMAIDVALGTPLGSMFQIDARVLWFLVLIVLLVPLQATAEEYVFRGYAMQLIGSWVRHPALPILAPVPLFVLAHGYGLWGSLSVGFFAFVAGYLAWRTGGLEAAIALHVIHNIMVMTLDVTAAPVEGGASEESYWGVLFVLALLVAFAGWAQIAAKRSGVQRTVRIAQQNVVA